MKRDTKRILRIHRLLLDEYGDPLRKDHDPMDTLVSAILSQNTSDTNRDRAMGRLVERFTDWEAVRDARQSDVLDAIRPAGLGPTKAPRIQEALRRIGAERGELKLDFLSDLPLDEARRWLIDLPGVGPKSAAIVLLFALNMPAFPVDTHIHRLAGRLGLLPARTGREKAHEVLEAIVPREIYYAFHINLIAHGRGVCHARKPEHVSCLLRSDCALYSELEGSERR